MYCSSTTTYEMLGVQDIPNTYGDLSSEQGTMNLTAQSYTCVHNRSILHMRTQPLNLTHAYTIAQSYRLEHAFQ
jgi:hypothetical protein